MKRLALALLILSTAAAGQEAPPVDPSADEFTKAVFFGRKFFDLKEYGSAYDQYAKADAVRPDDPGVLYNMALLLAKSGRYSEAQVKVDRYNQLHPAGAEKPLVSQLQLELEFQRELQKKRQSDQDYGEMFNRGKFQYGRNDLEAALKSFRDAEQLRPTDPAAVYNQAVIYEKQGDFAKAAERFRRYGELEPAPDQKSRINQRIFAIENEIERMRTKIVCSFCGHRLEASATWCHRCWHGPYTTTSAILNTRACASGVNATRTTYYSDSRLHKNDALQCLFPSGNVRQSLSYTPARQRAIRDARLEEGWVYDGEILQSWGDRQGNQLQFVQGPEYLEKVISPTTGESLEYGAHKSPDGVWLLDREDTIIEGVRYTSGYTFDEKGRLTQQAVTYKNTAACNHVITEQADLVYQNDALASVSLKGGYTGYPAEGNPKVDWAGTITYAYDGSGRVTREDLAITSFTKTYMQRPDGALRNDTSRLYLSMRPKRPIENAIRFGDLCATAGTMLLSNPIDLRPFYTISPNLAMTLPPGVVRATVSFTYPDSFSVR
ncbi:MAG TPA: tetratricopeptide repeat protein [Thermoanaerobaculia bacterium]|nr:tetratricopeptide repeat protein [Thermoanaerobaculia bacterium]